MIIQLAQNRQQGFSLIELMVAMLLGTFLIGGLISVFISSASSYKVQQALTEVQHKGRYILRMVRLDVQAAGFDLNKETELSVREFNGTPGHCAEGSSIFEVYSNEGGSAWRYCYYLKANNILMRGRVDGVDPVSPADDLEIAEGVMAWQLSYAVDNDGDGVIDQITESGNDVTYVQANTLQLAPQALAQPTWQEVRAVRLDVLVRSNTENVTSREQVIAAPFAAYDVTDNNLYQIFSATLALRNRIE